MKKIFSITALLFATTVGAVESKDSQVDKDFDALGGNRPILEKAAAINPQVSTTIVQNRMVDRNRRMEFSGELTNTVGGNPYNWTQGMALNAHYHWTPRWSVGAKYEYNFNNLTPEGQAAYDRALKDYAENPMNPRVPVPVIDFPKSQAMALIGWYPIYGKMNLIDKMVAHFDAYLLGGAGQIELNSGSTSTWTAGAGLGVWWTPHLASRFEARYQTYNAKSLVQEQKLDVVVGSVQMGWML